VIIRIVCPLIGHGKMATYYPGSNLDVESLAGWRYGCAMIKFLASIKVLPIVASVEVCCLVDPPEFIELS